MNALSVYRQQYVGSTPMCGQKSLRVHVTYEHFVLSMNLW